MIIAKIVSTRSTCNSRHNGCVIVKNRQILSTGYNGAMSGCKHCIDEISKNGMKYCQRREQNIPDIDKYNFCLASHAESNAVSLAAKFGISLKKSTAYCTLAPCFNCLKSLVVAGVKEVVYEYEYESKYQDRDNYWKSQLDQAGIISRKLQVSYHAINTIEDSLKYPTSKRILEATS